MFYDCKQLFSSINQKQETIYLGFPIFPEQFGFLNFFHQFAPQHCENLNLFLIRLRTVPPLIYKSFDGLQFLTVSEMDRNSAGLYGSKLETLGADPFIINLSLLRMYNSNKINSKKLVWGVMWIVSVRI